MLPQKYREGKNTSSRVAGDGLKHGSHGGRSVKRGLGGEVEFGQFEIRKRREEWKRLEHSQRGGRKSSGLRFPSFNWCCI